MAASTKTTIRTATCSECGFQVSGHPRNATMILNLHMKKVHNVKKSDEYTIKTSFILKENMSYNAESKKRIQECCEQLHLPENWAPKHSLNR